MDHKIELSGYGLRLRPVTVADAEFIVQLRTAATRSQYINSTSSAVTDQVDWIKKYFNRDNDFYFVVEHHGKPIGTVGIYDVDFSKGIAEWGRWIVQDGSVAAPVSAFLMYKAAFEVLNLNMLYSRTMSENVKVVAFHDKIGSIRAGRQQIESLNLTGDLDTFTIHVNPKENYGSLNEKLVKYCKLVERFL